MKTLFILSGILCAALSIMAASVPQAKAAAAGHQEEPAPKSEVNNDTAVAAGRAALQPQARFSLCPHGWQGHGTSCYYLNNNPDSWANAERYCAEFQSSLASAHDVWEYNFLQRMVLTGGHAFAWLGGYYFEGEWRWEDGSLFNYYNGQLSDIDRYQCLLLRTHATEGWTNHGCNMFFPFVCQRKLSC